MTGRNEAFDRFRGIGAVCVVMLHAPPLYHSSIETLRIAGWGLRELCQVAVPYFFLLSGWMLGAKWISGRREGSEFLRSVRRLLALYVPWFLLFWGLDLLAGLPSGGIEVLRRFAGFSDGRLETRGFHLWFLPSLVLAQGVVWLSLRRFGSALPAAIAGAVLYAGMGWLELRGQILPWGLAPHEGLDLSLLGVGAGAWLGGGGRGNRRVPAWIVVLAVPLFWIEGWTWNLVRGTRWEVYSFQPLRLVLPALLLLWLSDRPKFWGEGFAARFLDSVGRHSTGIYVSHLLFLELLPFERWVSSGFVRDNFVKWPVALGCAWGLSAVLGRSRWPSVRALVR